MGQVSTKDICYFRSIGIEVRNYVFDCAYAHSIIDENLPHDLAFMERWYGLGYGRYDEAIDVFKRAYYADGTNRMEEYPEEMLWQYAGLDAICTFELVPFLLKALKNKGSYESPFKDFKMRMFKVVTELEWNGLLVDKDYLIEEITKSDKKILRLEVKLKRLSGDGQFNPNSPQQVGRILQERELIDSEYHEKTPTGQLSVNKKVLQRVGRGRGGRIAELILKYRHLKKLLSTYYIPLLDKASPLDGRVRADFNGHSVVTHRLGSYIHTLPREAGTIRKAIIPPPGYVMCYADYKQLELRGIAIVSKDRKMIKDFNDGKDPLTVISARVNNISEDEVTKEQRHADKAIVYGLNYLRGDEAIARDNDLDLEYVQEIR